MQASIYAFRHLTSNSSTDHVKACDTFGYFAKNLTDEAVQFSGLCLCALAKVWIHLLNNK